ncbi:DUF4136 domain-containing protein [Lysobacter niabensis]|uniref:DUF4136 domain-containing protein n=1 Tax=Agrilutibacter niabensis TaxID=380628 RepID=UPI00361695D1
MNVIRFRALAPTSLLRSVIAGLLIAAAAGALLPATAVASPPQVKVLKPAAELPGTRYAWVPMPAPLPAEADPRVQDPQFRERLQAALDKALQAKGYQPAGSMAQADFFIAYRVGVRDLEQTLVKETAASPDTPEATFGCSGGDCSQLVTRGTGGVPTPKTTTEQQVEGGLLIEVLEPNSIRVVWRALNRGTVKRKDVRKVQLETVARNTLAQLPKASP